MGVNWMLAPLLLSCVTLGKLFCSLRCITHLRNGDINFQDYCKHFKEYIWTISHYTHEVRNMTVIKCISFASLVKKFRQHICTYILKFILLCFGTRPTWWNYNYAEGIICSDKPAKSESYKVVTKYQRTWLPHIAHFHQAQLDGRRARLGALLLVSRLDKEMLAPSVSSRSWSFFFCLTLSQPFYGNS